MGIGLDNILSDKGHFSDFVCPICQEVAEGATILGCSHVFCAFCIGEFQERQLKQGVAAACPVCRQGDVAGARPLAEANPLAGRIYNRVQCRCPLADQGCAWTGDLINLQGHLTNSSEHLDLKAAAGAATPDASGFVARWVGGAEKQPAEETAEAAAARLQRTADALKEQADQKYQIKAYGAASEIYGKAIAVCPDVATYRSNRGACHFMVGAYEACVQDCDAALACDATLVSAACRRARACVELGLTDEARSGLVAAKAAASEACAARGGGAALVAALKKLDGELERVAAVAAAVKAGRDAFGAGDVGRAAASFGGALKDTESACIVLGAATAELGLGRVDRCLRLTLQVLRRSDAARWRPAALIVRGAAMVLSDQGEGGIALLREALRLDPDGADAKKTTKAALRLGRRRDAAKALMNRRAFDDAAAAYGELLDEDLGQAFLEKRQSMDAASFPDLAALAPVSPLAAVARAERANCHLRRGEPVAAVSDCATAIYIKDDLVDAHVTRATALGALGKHDDACGHLRDVVERWGGRDVRLQHAYEQADFERRKKLRPDYYAMLDCRKVSSEREIKGAYWKQSLAHHPDKHAAAAPDVRARHEAQFKALGEALEVLSDPMKRDLYDKGYDKEAIAKKLEAANRAANNAGGCCGGGGCGSGGCG